MNNNINVNFLLKNELMTINGGGGFVMVYDWASFYLFKSIYEFTKDAAEYQASLPPNLKK